jgi:hypothetical protein
LEWMVHKKVGKWWDGSKTGRAREKNEVQESSLATKP